MRKSYVGTTENVSEWLNGIMNTNNVDTMNVIHFEVFIDTPITTFCILVIEIVK